MRASLLIGLAMAVALAAGCGGGGSSAPTPGAPTPGAAASAPDGAASSPGAAASSPVAAPPAGVVVTVSNGSPVIALSASLRVLDIPYQDQYRHVAGGVLAMAYSAASDELVVSGYVLDGARPGVQGLDPTTFAVRWSIATSSAANVVAVSDDGSTVFAGLCDEFAIAQLNVRARSTQRRFEVAAGKEVCAGDIQSRPGNPTTIAATVVLPPSFVPRSYGTVMFRDGIALPREATTLATPLAADAVKLRFLDATRLVGYSYFVSTSRVLWHSVDDQGVTLDRVADAASYSGWGEDFQAVGTKLFFSGAVVADQNDLVRPIGMRGCLGASGYAVAAPGATAVLCVTSVPQSQRKRPKDVELQLDEWSLVGQRLLGRVRINLSGVVTIPGLATPEVEVRKVVALPGGQIVLHIWDFQSNRILLLGLNRSNLVPVAEPAIQYFHKDEAGVALDWFDLPAVALAHSAVSNATFALVTGAYGPRGASLAQINAATKRVERFLLLDHEPHRLALSADGRYAYVASDYQIDQIDLLAWSRGWSWQSANGGIKSMDVRPGSAAQLAVVTDDRVNWVSNGQTLSAAPRRNAGSLTPGDVVFSSGNSLAEFTPSVGFSTSTYQLDDVRRELSAGTPVQAGTGMSATSFASGFGLAYSRSGEVVDLSTLYLYGNAPSPASYWDSSVGSFTVSYPGGLTVGGAFTVDGFVALSRDRYLAARPFGSGIMFDMRDGLSLTKRFVVADPRHLVDAPLAAFAAVARDTAAFGQTSGGYTGVGAVYFMRVSD